MDSFSAPCSATSGKVLTGDFDPVPHADVVTTTTHKSLRGPRGGIVLSTGEYREQVERGCPMVLGGPLSHVMAAKAVALVVARRPAFRDYAQAVVDNAVALAEGLMKRGARLLTGGTDNHLVVIDVASSYGLTGRQPSRPCSTPGSSPTATPSRPTPTGPGTPAGSAWAPPPSPRWGCGGPNSTRWPTSSTPPCGPPSRPRPRADPPMPATCSTRPNRDGPRRCAELLSRFPLYSEIQL